MDPMNPGTPAPRANVELHVDELILHGFAAGDRHRIAAALERELSRLIAQSDLAHLQANPMQLDRLDAGSFHLDHAARPSHIGQIVAQRIYRQLSPTVSATGGRNHA
jgi:hypothetical protein